MGTEVYPVFKPRVPEATFDSDGKAILREHIALDNIASERRLTPLSSFGDNREIPEDFDGDPDELEELLGEWEEWFSIDDGLKTVDGLIHAIRNDRQIGVRIAAPQSVIEGLESLAACLRVALEKNGVLFRLEIA